MGREASGWEDPKLGCPYSPGRGGCDDPRTCGMPLPGFQAGAYKYFTGVAEPCQVAFASGRVNTGRRGGGKGGRGDALRRCVISQEMRALARGLILEGLHSSELPSKDALASGTSAVSLLLVFGSHPIRMSWGLPPGSAGGFGNSAPSWRAQDPLGRGTAQAAATPFL